jgi:hypothetical protein
VMHNSATPPTERHPNKQVQSSINTRVDGMPLSST